MGTPLEKLKLLTAWETEPVLTEGELGEALASSALTDANGLTPANEEWTPTYDINAAAAESWLIKAARASTLTETEPGSGIVTAKVFDNCRAMARMYRSKRNMSVAAKTSYA